MKKNDLQNREINHSSGERLLQGKKLPFSNSPVRSVIRHKGDIRVIVFENGQRKQMTKRQLKGFIHGAIAAKMHKESIQSMRPTPKGKMKVKLKGSFIAAAERTMKSRQHTIEMLEEVYGKGQVRGTRFSKASRFGQAREALRSHVRAMKLPAKYIK
jgi:hypothetical protein